MRIIAVLGSTGSIGTNTLDVVRRNHHLYEVYSLVAGQNIEILAAQILEFRPKLAVVATSDGLARLTECLTRSGLPRTDWPELGWGGAARVEAVRAAEVDTVISAIVGVAGLEATYEAVCLGKRVGLPIRKYWFPAAAWSCRPSASMERNSCRWTANITGRINACVPATGRRSPG